MPPNNEYRYVSAVFYNNVCYEKKINKVSFFLFLQSIFSLHQIQVQYLIPGRYQSVRPLLTKVQGGLLLGVWDGGRGVRYRTSFLPENIAQVLEKWIS
jgi:hypothetical protein